MTDYEIDYSFYGANKDAIECTETEVLVIGPAETGKTIALLWKLHRLAFKYKDASLVIMRKTLTSTYGTVLQTFKEKILGEDSPVKPYGGEKPQWFDYPTGSRIWIAGMDKSTRILSAGHDAIMVNQPEELTLDEWETLTTRTTGRAGHIKYPQLMGDPNPAYPQHWMYTREDITRFYSWHKDNPNLWDGENWTEQGMRTRAQLMKLTGVRRQRLFEGKAAQAEGVVYEQYNDAKHRIYEKDLPPMQRYVGGQDWGYTNPGFLGVFGIGWDGHVYLVAQVYRTGEGIQWWAERAKELHAEYRFESIQCGAEQPAYIASYQKEGLPAMAAFTDVLPGITNVQERLDQDRLFLVRDSLRYADPELERDRLPMCIEDEFPAYVWADNKKDVPVKELDHGLDACRYALARIDRLSRKARRKVKAGWVV